LPRTNTEIDRDLKETKAAVVDVENFSKGIQVQVDSLRSELQLGGAFLREILTRVEGSLKDSLNRHEAAHERFRLEQVRTAEALAELKAKVERLEKSVDAVHSLLWKMFFVLLAAAVPFLFGVWKDSILGWMRS
jgi:hypothetical protein